MATLLATSRQLRPMSTSYDRQSLFRQFNTASVYTTPEHLSSVLGIEALCTQKYASYFQCNTLYTPISLPVHEAKQGLQLSATLML